jgi:hypothetical protein
VSQQQPTLDRIVIQGELQEFKKALEELKRTLEQLGERLTKVEADTGVSEIGLNEIYRTLELHGLMQDGEPVQDSKRKPAAVSEENFALTFEDKQGEKLGQYGIAFKKSNLSDKFQSACNILRQSNATISKRYCGAGYAYSYWLYGSDDRVFRQKLKAKTEASP